MRVNLKLTPEVREVANVFSKYMNGKLFNEHESVFTKEENSP